MFFPTGGGCFFERLRSLQRSAFVLRTRLFYTFEKFAKWLNAIIATFLNFGTFTGQVRWVREGSCWETSQKPVGACALSGFDQGKPEGQCIEPWRERVQQMGQQCRRTSQSSASLWAAGTFSCDFAVAPSETLLSSKSLGQVSRKQWTT